MSAASIRITVRNLPYSYTEEDCAKDVVCAAAKLPAAYLPAQPDAGQPAPISIHWFHPGDAPSKFLQQQVASGSKKVLGPIPGWVILCCRDKRVAELCASYFDGRALQPEGTYPSQTASVEFPVMQQLPALARRAMGSEDVESARAEAGSIFADADFLAFKKSIEEEAAAPIPCSQDSAFEFLNKWLARSAASDTQSAGGAAEDEEKDGAVRGRKGLTFLEKVRLRYEGGIPSSSSSSSNRAARGGGSGGGSKSGEGRAELSKTSGAARRRRQLSREEQSARKTSSRRDSGSSRDANETEKTRKRSSRKDGSGGGGDAGAADGERRKRRRGGKRERERRERREAAEKLESVKTTTKKKSAEDERRKKRPAASDSAAFPTFLSRESNRGSGGSSNSAASGASSSSSWVASAATGTPAASVLLAVPRSRTSAAAAKQEGQQTAESPSKNKFTVSNTRSTGASHADPAAASAPATAAAPKTAVGVKKIMIMRRPPPKTDSA